VNRLSTPKSICFLMLLAAVTVSPAQTFTTLFDFNGPSGATPGPAMQLVEGFDGYLWGTTTAGGSAGAGTIFKLNKTTSFLSIVHSFDSAVAYEPWAGLALAPNGVLYGTTAYGGTDNLGNFFSISRSGSFKTPGVGFNGSNGSYPLAGLMHASSGYFYGTDSKGGLYGMGTIFQVIGGGMILSVVDLQSEAPYTTLVQDRHGVFYGTLPYGGTSGKGEVFYMDALGAGMTTHSFSGPDGETPIAGLVQGSNGDFYGTTWYGGTDNVGTIFTISATGSYFRTLHNFLFYKNGYKKGYNPMAALVEGSDGNFYGTASSGGFYDDGAIFKITPGGQYSVIYSFSSSDESPSSALVQATDGNFYGTLQYGGANNLGIVYRLATGLAPFVKILPGRGTVGSTINIYGPNFSGATAVKFNGTPATFTLAPSLSTLIQATVPAGATTGPVEVTTPGGTFLSNTKFRVY